MDPNACFERLLDAIRLRDEEAAFYAANDLRDWIARGGAEPDWSEDDRTLFPTIHKALRDRARTRRIAVPTLH